MASDLVERLEGEAARLRADNERLTKERDEARANSVSRGKKLLRFRAKLIEISDHIEHEGDRAYFGSTNHADELREIFLWLDGFKWDRVTSESDEDDLLSAVERLLARATAAEARAEKMAEALKSLVDQPCAYHGNVIHIPADSHGDAMMRVTRARAALRALAETKP